MKQLWRVLGMLSAAVLMSYFLLFAWRSFDTQAVVATFEQKNTIPVLLCSTIFYMTIYPLAGMAWRQLLLKQGQDRPTGELVEILCIAQLAKYVPGNFAQHASRAALAIKRGIPVKPYVATVVQETLLAVAASVIVGTLLLLFVSKDISGLGEYREVLLLMLAASLAGVFISCIDISNSTSHPIISRLYRISGRLPGSAVTLRALAAYGFNYLMIGFGVWILALPLGLTENIDYSLATAAFSLSWVLGLLTPGAPAGLGAREGMMTLILQGHGSSGQIVQLVLLVRVVSVLGDIASFVIAVIHAGVTSRGRLNSNEN